MCLEDDPGSGLCAEWVAGEHEISKSLRPY